ELDTVELAVHFLDLVDVHVLDDVAGISVDAHRPTRTFPLHALHGVDEGGSIGRAVGLLERFVDHVHAVPASDRNEVRTQAAVRRLEGCNIGRVDLRTVRGRIDPRRHYAQHRVAHARQVVVVDQVAGSDTLDAGLVEPALGELLGEGAGLAGGHEYEQRIGPEIAGTLQEWREVRILQRHLDRLEDLPAGL